MTRFWALLPMLALLSAAPLPSEDAAVLRATLQRIGGDTAKGYCITPTLLHRAFTDMRSNLAESSDILTLAPEARRKTVGQWQAQTPWTGADGKPLTGAVRQQLDDAVVALVLADPFPPPPRTDEAVGELNGTDGTPAGPEPVADGPTITPDLLQPGQQLQPTIGCVSVTLSNVAPHGDWAFVEIGIVAGPLSGAGDQWAFRRTGGKWRWVAANRIWIS